MPEQQNLNNTQPLSKTLKIIVSASLGNALEFYEFTVFGFLSSVFVQLLSSSYPKADLVVAYSVFAVGFFFRPLGALFFGYMGDKYGRKKALCGSILMMGSATFLMGCVPFSAPLYLPLILLVSLRILQGISAGGEFNGAVIYAVENTSPKYRGFIASLVAGTGMIGVILGGFVGKGVLNSSDPLWFWRYAFWAGIILSGLALWMRTRLQDVFEHKNKAHAFALRDVFCKTNLVPFVSGVLLSGVGGLLVYMKSVFLSGVEGKDSYLSLLSSVMLLVIPPFFGLLSDFVGRKKILAAGVICLLSIGCFAALFPGLEGRAAVITLVLFGISSGMYIGAMHTIMFESFQEQQRYTGVALSYSLGMGFIGGSSPLVAHVLMSGDQGKLNIFAYFTTLCVLALGSVFYNSYIKGDNSYSSHQKSS